MFKSTNSLSSVFSSFVPLSSLSGHGVTQFAPVNLQKTKNLFFLLSILFIAPGKKQTKKALSSRKRKESLSYSITWIVIFHCVPNVWRHMKLIISKLEPSVCQQFIIFYIYLLYTPVRGFSQRNLTTILSVAY